MCCDWKLSFCLESTKTIFLAILCEFSAIFTCICPDLGLVFGRYPKETTHNMREHAKPNQWETYAMRPRNCDLSTKKLSNYWKGVFTGSLKGNRLGCHGFLPTWLRSLAHNSRFSWHSGGNLRALKALNVFSLRALILSRRTLSFKTIPHFSSSSFRLKARGVNSSNFFLKPVCSICRCLSIISFLTPSRFVWVVWVATT